MGFCSNHSPEEELAKVVMISFIEIKTGISRSLFVRLFIRKWIWILGKIHMYYFYVTWYFCGFSVVVCLILFFMTCMCVCVCMTVITGTVITAVMKGGSMYATVSIINVYKEGSLAIQQAGKTMSTKIIILCKKCPFIRRGEFTRWN